MILAACLASGCTMLSPNQPVADPSTPSKATVTSAMLNDNLKLVQQLLQGTASDQAEIVSAAQHEFDTTPSPSKKLRLALILATPDHPATDLPRAQELLRELVARPEELVPAERALAYFELKQIDNNLTLQAENRRLEGDAHERERLAAANRTLTKEAERLGNELKEARAKLDAIANIERSLDEHDPHKKPSTEGHPQ
jgi:hypothetical protein